MAASATAQSVITRPMMSSVAKGCKQFNQQFLAPLPSQHRNSPLLVRCANQEGQNEAKERTTLKQMVSPKFLDIFAFGGPAPETINGRLAMVGFVAAMAVELTTGKDLAAQVSTGGLGLFVVTSVVLTVASLVPLSQGASPKSKSDWVMTSDAEMLNGRMAMLGLVALAFTEYVKGGALV